MFDGSDSNGMEDAKLLSKPFQNCLLNIITKLIVGIKKIEHG